MAYIQRSERGTQRLPRVPEDAPYVVRPNGRRCAWLYGPLLALQLILCGFLLVILWTSDDALASFVARSWPVILAMSVVVGAHALVWWLAAGGGPRLAIGPDGLWLRGLNRPVRVHFLRWDQLDLGWLDRRHVLCLRAGNPAHVAGWRGQAGVEVARAMRRYGAPFAVPLGTNSDRPDAEVLAALRDFSSGSLLVQDMTSH